MIIKVITFIKIIFRPAIGGARKAAKAVKIALAAFRARFARSRRLQISALILAIFTPLALLGLWLGREKAIASWFDDNFFYRQIFTFGNTGAAVSNQKVKIDLNTAALVETNTTNFNTTDSTFTPAMAKRNAPGPFAAAPIVQSKDVLSASQGTQINGNFYANFDTTQGSVALWYTPEYATGTDKKYIWYVNSNYYLAYDYANTRYEQKIGSQTQTVASTLAAGTTYGLITRWDTQNVIQGTNYADLSINDSQNFGITTQPTVSAPASTIYIGTDGTTAADGIIEGLTVYRRVLYDGANGINAGNGDEVATIKLTSGTDPTLTTGSWDVVFALPTNSTVGALTTGTGNAWSHPHSSNLLYTSTTNTGGFMMNGTYTSDGWAAIGSPTVAALATGSKIFSGGYSTASSGAANEGISYTKALTASANYVIRALGNSDGTCNPQVLVTRADGTTEITHLNGTTTSTRTAPDSYIFTFKAPATENGIFKLINTAATGTCSWHQVEVQSNAITNPSFEAGSGDPWIPTGCTSFYLDPGESAQDTINVHSGSSAFKTANAGVNRGIRCDISTAVGLFYTIGGFVKVTSGEPHTFYTASAVQYFSTQANPSTALSLSFSATSFSHKTGVMRSSYNGGQGIIFATSVASGNGTLDDVYSFPLTAVSLTVTASNAANSAESSGLRVDGRDTLTQTISNLTTTAGTIKFKYTPRHSAADAVKFMEVTDTNIAEFYGGANDTIQLSWSAANTVKLLYKMNSTTANTTWAATGAIVAGTTYAMQIDYTGGSTMTLSVDGVNKITLSSIPAAFGTTPTTAYWGSLQAGSRQTDATFAAGTVTTGVKMQTDCDDIRFTDINGQALDYYFDSANGPCNTLTSDFYVLMPTINTGNNIIHIYYGNPSASSGSRSSQFSEATFAPTSGPTASSEEKGGAPVAYWKFDDATGTNAQDSSPNNNDGTLGGTTVPTWQNEDQCISGKCLFFDGATSKVTGSVVAKNVQTVSFWIRPNTIATQGLVNLDGGTHKLNTNSSGVLSAAGFTSPVYYLNGKAVSSLTLVLNQWNFVSVTTATGFDSTSSWTVGTNGTNFQKGFLDDVKIYNYARTAAQVKADFASRGTSKGSSASTLNAQSSTLSNGLVGYWKMDETSGDRADSSGNGNTLTDNNTVTSNPGKFGNAGQFTAANSESLSISDNANLSVGDIDFMFSTWIYLDSKPAYMSAIGKATDFNNDIVDYQIYYQGGGVDRIRFQVSNGTNFGVVSANALGSPSLSTWYFVVAWHDATNNTINISVNDGATTSTSYSFGSYDSAGTFKIGNTTPNYYWDGRIDEVRMYNRVLSPKEVRDLYNWAPGPRVYLKMEEGSGTAANDDSGNARTGTLNGNPIWAPGKYGKGVKLDGTGDYLQITDF